LQEDDYWADEDQLQLGDVPEDLWSNAPLDKMTPQPEQWVDRLADGVETNHLLAMGVLGKRTELSQRDIDHTLCLRLAHQRAQVWQENVDAQKHVCGPKVCCHKAP
jgi:hypothetical protein